MVTAALVLSALAIVIGIASIGLSIATERRIRAAARAVPSAPLGGFEYVIDRGDGIRRFNIPA